MISLVSNQKLKNFLSSKYLIYSICFMLFIDALAQGLIFPIIPELFWNNKFGLVINDSYLSREVLYSITFALFPLVSMIGMPTLGSISDKYGRKKVILYGLGGLVLNQLLSIVSILTHTIWLFLLGIMLSGFLSGTYAVGSALISDISDTEEQRISNFKLSTLASLIGFISGPGLSIFVGKIDIGNPLITPFIIAFILGVANFVLLWNNFKSIIFKDVDTNNRNLNSNNSSIAAILLKELKLILISLTYIFTNKNTKILAVTYLIAQFGFGLFLQSLSLNLLISYNYTTTQIGRFFVIMAIATTFSMYLLQKLVDRYIKCKVQIKLGLIAISALLFFAASTRMCNTEEYMTWIITIMFYILSPFINLGFINLFAVSVRKKEQGRIMGGNGQVCSIAWFVSGLIVGKLITNYNVLLLISGISITLSYLMFDSFLRIKHKEAS